MDDTRLFLKVLPRARPCIGLRASVRSCDEATFLVWTGVGKYLASLPATELLEMILVGNLAWGAQFFLSKSLTLEKAGKATSMTFLKVLLSYVFGAAFLGETVTLPSVAGAVLVVAASYAVVTS